MPTDASAVAASLLSFSSLPFSVQPPPSLQPRVGLERPVAELEPCAVRRGKDGQGDSRLRNAEAEDVEAEQEVDAEAEVRELVEEVAREQTRAIQRAEM